MTDADGQDNYIDRRCPTCHSRGPRPGECPHRVICEACGVHACGECTVYDTEAMRYVCDVCSVNIKDSKNDG